MDLALGRAGRGCHVRMWGCGLGSGGGGAGGTMDGLPLGTCMKGSVGHHKSFYAYPWANFVQNYGGWVNTLEVSVFLWTGGFL